MNAKYLIPLAVPLTGAAVAPQAYARDDRPNIILFMVDDMGWQDTSVPFFTERTFYNGRFETPNMERLARQGMMFTEAYACSLSSPTRCSLMTGCNAARHRVTNWTLRKNSSTDAENERLVFPEWNVNGIAQSEGTERSFVATSFVELLRRSGYHTIHCGKAHWGAIDTPGENPHHFGFEVNIAGHAAGGPATYLSERNYGHDANGAAQGPFAIPGLERYWQSGAFLTEALTREAIAALEKAARYDAPFYLYMAHYAVHVPVDRDMRYYEKYLRRGFSAKEAAYASLVEGMDASLGEIMDWLEENGEADNTVIIFMSDNGGLCSEEWRDGEPYTQNHPLSCGKGSAREGGVRVPLIVRWPGVTESGGRCGEYVIIEDFFPTVLEIAGVSMRGVPQHVDGVSFVPLLDGSGDPSKGRSLYWNFPNNWEGGSGPGIAATAAIRRGDMKLIYYYETGEKELFDLRRDIGETHNLAAENPAEAKRLSRRLGRFLRGCGAQRPVFRESGRPCPWPDEVR